MKTDKELLDEIKAGQELEKMGYHKVACPSCEGKGYLPFFQAYPCYNCNGKGTVWEAPMMR